MRTIVSVIDAVTAWAREHICSAIQLKVPPDNASPMDAEYTYRLDHPEAIPMYLSPGDKLPTGIRFTHPSLCVRFLKAADNVAGNTGYVDVQMIFSVWDPGDHGEDLYLPNGDGSYEKRSEPGFEKGSSGWRDVWNFVDIARRALGSASSIDGMALDRSTDIEYGPITEQGSIVDAYPYWYSWITFRLTYSLMRNNQEIETFL